MRRFTQRVFHENFEGHQEAAGRRVVTEDEADDVWFGARVMVPNRKRNGSYLMVGLTRGGRRITVVCLEIDNADDVWLLYTAW